MPVQQSQKSKSATRKRKAANRLKAIQVTTCTNCGAAVLPHRGCKKCGHSTGKQVIEIKSKEEAK